MIMKMNNNENEKCPLHSLRIWLFAFISFFWSAAFDLFHAL